MGGSRTMAGTKPGRCRAVSKSGKPCGAAVVAVSGMCAWHAPEWAERRRVWSAKGGTARSNQARAKKQLPAGVLTIDQLRGVVGITIAKVLAGTTEPAVANAIANLARAYGSLSEAAKAEELAARLDELETVAGRRGAS